MNDYENKSQAYAILSAQYSKDAYFVSQKNFFSNSAEVIKMNCDLAIVYSEQAIVYADSAILVADDTSKYAKGIMLYAKKNQKKAIEMYANIKEEYDGWLIHQLSEESMYAMGNALTDAYKASLAFKWKENRVKNDEDNGEDYVEDAIYRIQIGFFQKKLPVDYFDDAFPLKSQISYEKKIINGKEYYRHVAGSFVKYEHAKMVQENIIGKGYKDAFVVAYVGNEKVDIKVALKQEESGNELIIGGRDYTRLESDENSFITIKELYTDRLLEIKSEINLLKIERSSNNGTESLEINNALSLLEIKEKEYLQKIKESGDKLTSIKHELSVEMMGIVSEKIFNTDKKGFYNQNVPIPTDVEIPMGLVYRIQIGFFSNEILPEHFDGVFPISSQKVDDVYYRYEAGNFSKYKDAASAKESVTKKGYIDSFLIAYYDGKKLSISEALQIESKTK